MKPGQYWDVSWNVTTGCTPVSAGCAHCWTSDMAKRFPQSHGRVEDCSQCHQSGRGCSYCHDEVAADETYWPPIPFSTVLCHPDRLDKPLHWVKPRVVFVSLMGDLGHKDVPTSFFWQVWEVIEKTPQHTYLLLTKRPHAFLNILGGTSGAGLLPEVPALPNVWLGVSVENQATADERIPILLDTPAAHRWVSVEPMLGAVDLLAYIDTPGTTIAVDWVVAGCESINGRPGRPALHDWFRSLRDQCADAGVPFSLKQVSNEDGTGKVVKAPLLDGVVHDSTGWRYDAKETLEL